MQSRFLVHTVTQVYDRHSGTDQAPSPLTPPFAFFCSLRVKFLTVSLLSFNLPTLTRLFFAPFFFVTIIVLLLELEIHVSKTCLTCFVRAAHCPLKQVANVDDKLKHVGHLVRLFAHIWFFFALR